MHPQRSPSVTRLSIVGDRRMDRQVTVVRAAPNPVQVIHTAVHKMVQVGPNMGQATIRGFPYCSRTTAIVDNQIIHCITHFGTDSKISQSSWCSAGFFVFHTLSTFVFYLINQCYFHGTCTPLQGCWLYTKATTVSLPTSSVCTSLNSICFFELLGSRTG